MRLVRLLAPSLGLLLFGPWATAQGTDEEPQPKEEVRAPKAGEPGGAAAKKPKVGADAAAQEDADGAAAGEGESDDDDDEAPAPKKPAPKIDDDPKAQPEAQLPPLDFNAQTPRPVLVDPMRENPDRIVTLGPIIGVTARTADDPETSYKAGLSWGLEIHTEPLSFVAVRAFFTRTLQPISIVRGGLGIEDSQVDEPKLEVTLLAIRLEPTWVVHPQVRLFAGVGAGWGRAVAPGFNTLGERRISTAERSGVFVEYSAAVGGLVDIVPDWIALTASMSAGVHSAQTGDLFEINQGVDQNGQIVQVDPLPKFAHTYSALFGVNVIF